MSDRRARLLCLTPLMESRTTAILVSGAAAVQGGLTWAGLPAWSCPVLHALGVPCPGCGLTRASAALLRGDLYTAFHLHAFAPALVAGLLLLGCAAVLPERHRRPLISGVRAVERQTGVSALLLAGLLCYWLARLAFSPEAFIQMVKG